MGCLGDLFDFRQAAGRGGEGHQGRRGEITFIKGTVSLGAVLREDGSSLRRYTDNAEMKRWNDAARSWYEKAEAAEPAEPFHQTPPHRFLPSEQTNRRSPKVSGGDNGSKVVASRTPKRKLGPIVRLLWYLQMEPIVRRRARH